MTINILDVLKKEAGITTKETIVKPKKFIKYATGEYYIYFNNNTNFEGLTKFFKEKGHNITSNSDSKHIYIKSKKTEEYISTEHYLTDEKFINSIQNLEDTLKKNSNHKTIIEQNQKLNIAHLIKARTETEAKYILLLALYISQNNNVILYDTYNDEYFDEEKLQKIKLN